MDWILSPEGWIAFLTLLALELVLGIDNIVFISILSENLPEKERARARFLGLGGALVLRILLLASLSWIMGLTKPLFAALGREISGRDLVLVLGGLFLLAKSTHEIHKKIEGGPREGLPPEAVTFAGVLTQIIILDAVFSLDSVITAVGMVDELAVMVSAVVAAVLLMMLFAGWVTRFLDRYPTLKMLALGFLLMVGALLVADGLGHHVPRGYAYFAMAFSGLIEALNIRVRGLKARARGSAA